MIPGRKPDLEKRARAQELRRQGLTYAQIGAAMGVSGVRAFYLVNPDRRQEYDIRRIIKEGNR